MSKYQEHIQTYQDRLEKVNTLFTEIGDAEPTTEQRDELKKLYKEAEDAEARAADLKSLEDMQRDVVVRQRATTEIVRTFGGDMSREKVDKQGLSFTEQTRQVKSIGQEALEDPQFKSWLGAVKVDSRIQSPPFHTSPRISTKTLVTGASSTSAGAFVVTDRLRIVDEGTIRRPLTIVDLITVGQTDSDTVEYVRQGAHTNNAAVVAEATATGDGSGAKPESAMVFAIVTEVVKTIAHWIPASRQALADASQIRTMIDSWLRYGLDEEMEDQILNGSGTGINFTGITNTSGTTTQAWDTNILTTTRKARTKVRVTGRATPTGYALHPTEWETIDLLQDNEARYYFGGPTQLGTPRLWGLPVVESEAVVQGTGIVADWRLAALWMRMQAAIYVSDSHADFFIRNLIAILAEERAAFGVIRPAAFVEMDLLA
jgi:HK97 family phage major capsid protein